MSFRNEKVFNAVSEDEAMLAGQGSFATSTSIATHHS